MHTYTLYIESLWCEKGVRLYYLELSMIVNSKFGEVYRNTLKYTIVADSPEEALEIAFVRLKHKAAGKFINITNYYSEVENDDITMLIEDYMPLINAAVFSDDKSKNFFL